jgi:hypothetical protein
LTLGWPSASFDDVTVAGIAGALLLCGAPVDADAAAAPPPPANGSFWTAEERPVRLRLLSPAARRTGQSIFLQATISLDESCVYPGPVFEVRDAPAGSPQKFKARVWRQNGVPCERVSRFAEQPLHRPTYKPGTVRFASGNTVIEVKVSGKPQDRDRDDDASSRPCRFDDDCWVTDVCVPRKRDPAGLGICAEICGGAFDCAPGRCDRGPAIVGICSDRVVGCNEQRACEWGQVCTRGGYCHWPTRLDSGSRHACQNDPDCGPGLKCFKRDGANAAHGRCELLCNSSNMACEGAHECRGVGICEWLGG